MKFSQLLLVAAFAAASPLAAQAQHGHAAGSSGKHVAAGETHAHSAPHGGVVRSANPYYMELVQQPTELRIYLLGDKMAALPNKSLSGKVMLQTTDNKTTTVPLVAGGPDYVVAKLPAGARARTAIVSLKTGDKALNVRFDKLDAAAKPGKAAAAAYTCPMSCEGSASAKPGSCPKCGMALVKNS